VKRSPGGGRGFVTAVGLALATWLCFAARPGRIRAAGTPKPSATAVSPSTAGAPKSSVAAISPTAIPTPAALSFGPNERANVINFLGEAIAWYRRIVNEHRLATEPAETLYVENDRQTGLEALRFAFQYSRAMAALLNAARAAKLSSASLAAASRLSVPQAQSSNAAPDLATMTATVRQQQQNLDQLKQQAAQLNSQIAVPKDGKRPQLIRQLAFLQAQIELVQARIDSYNSLIQFETSTETAPQQAGLLAQIDALERSVPELRVSGQDLVAGANTTPQDGVAQTSAQAAVTDGSDPVAITDEGLLGSIESLVRLANQERALTNRKDDTGRLAEFVVEARNPLVTRIRYLNARADAIAKQPSSEDLAATRSRKDQLDGLIKEHKLIADALMPLAKQGVLLQAYITNLQQWHDAVDQRWDSRLRRMLVRLTALGLVLLVIFAGAYIWSRVTLRYVHDFRRRRQLLRLRRLTTIVLVGIVLIFEFTSQLGTFATVMGFAAAGIAFALQNVILSFAGYFFVTGRYGIRVGDRIQIAGISGDVVEIGLFKLALMELASDGSSRLPTGRVVVFPNSIVFQANGNFFRQAPGTTFVWNEFRLTLAPDCDYRVAEKRLLEVVEEVYARYRDTVQRQYTNLERELNMKFEPPRPQSRLWLDTNGIELSIRYPADTRHAVQVADEISRRALDAIAQDPALSLAVPGTPNLQPLQSHPGNLNAAASGGPNHQDPPPHGAEAGSGMLPAGVEVIAPSGGEAPPPPSSRKDRGR
jgi:small-conductance mechanosensitive channel